MATDGRRRILYGVHGYGRGHAARAQAILPELTRRYEVRILAGDDAYDQLRPDWPVVRIPTLRYHHDADGRRRAGLTLRRNLSAALDMLLGGPIFQMVCDEIRRFEPHVVLSDSEGWTHRAGRALGIGRISFDHYGVMALCAPPMSPWARMICRAETLVYRALVCRPERAVVVAFFDARRAPEGVRVVGPLLRREVLDQPPREGEYLLAYVSNAEVNFTPRLHQALREAGVPVKVYGPKRTGREGNLEFRPIGNLPFVRDLAGCRAVLATAGNQLISEAIHFGKPLLLMPEESLEQRLNAEIVEGWSAGMRTTGHRVSGTTIRRFLARREEFAANVARHRRNGLAEALDALDDAVEDLARSRRPAAAGC